MFTLSAWMPLAATVAVPATHIVPVVAMSSLLLLAALGVLAAYLGKTNILTRAVHVIFWGALAMGITALTSMLSGIIV